MLCAAALGTTLYFLGAFAPARLHLEQGIALTGMGFQALPADNVTNRATTSFTSVDSSAD
jgi:hypothetical protein